MTRFALPSVLLLAALGMPVLGCSSTQAAARSAEDADTIDAQEQLIRYRSVLRELRGHRFASDAGPDLDRAESWISMAETRLAGEDADEVDATLLLDAIKGQLVLVRSFYGRRAAETELEETRKDYEDRVTRGRDTDDAEADE